MSFFIVLEGPDGSGTTKHTELLAERLRRDGVDTLLTAEPTSGPIGTEIRGILSSTSLPSPEAVQLLFCADRAEHVENVLKPALAKGSTVVCDRYALSTCIYGSVFGVDRKWLESINAHFPEPDLTIITLPPYEVCAERMGRRSTKDQFEQDDFQRRIYKAYSEVEGTNVIFLDTSGEKEEVADRLYKQVKEFLGKEKVSK